MECQYKFLNGKEANGSSCGLQISEKIVSGSRIDPGNFQEQARILITQSHRLVT